jgi:hypothetical protein
MSASDDFNSGALARVSSRPSEASAGTHTPQSIDTEGAMGPGVRRDDGAAEPIQCICIDPAHVERVWPLVSHLIRAAMRKGRISEFADVERAVLEGAQLLWVAADRQAIWAAAVTQLSHANGEKFCTIVACGGRERARWLPLKAELETFAKAEGCAAIRIHGRRGWAREFPDYRLTRILLEKEL